MKKVTKLVVMSLLTVALCVSLIAGATFALFTSESNVNIAVSSGKVSMTATIENLSPYHYDASDTKVTGSFFSGTAALDGEGNLELNNVLPKDGIDFDIHIVNDSTVAVKWQLQIGLSEDTDDEGVKLFEQFDFGLTGVELVDAGSLRASKWSEPSTSTDPITLNVHMELPATVTEPQGASCKISILVRAIQGNAKTVDPEAVTPGDTSKMYIYNLADLKDFSAQSASDTFAGKTVYLMENIDLAGEEWEPIGSRAHEFSGTFEGNGLTISNLTINKPKQDYVGLFGYVNKGSVQNLNVSNANVVGKDYVGAVIGYFYGEGSYYASKITVNNVTVTGQMLVGGILGDFMHGVAQDLTVSGDVHINGAYQVGGVAGGIFHDSANNLAVKANAGSTVTATYSAVDFEGDKVGGVIGFTETSSEKMPLENLYASNITVKGTRAVGGAVGIANEGRVIDGVTLDNVVVDNLDTPEEYAKAQSSRLNVGGVVGEACKNVQITVDGSALTNVTVNTLYVYPNAETLIVTGEHKPSQVLGNVRSVSAPDSVTLTIIGDLSGVTVNMAASIMEEAEVIHVYNEKGFVEFAQHYDEEPWKGQNAKTIVLENDLDLTSYGSWQALGYGNNSATGFCCDLDGQGHTIKYNIDEVDPSQAYYGLVGYMDYLWSHGSIKNLVVEGTIKLSGTPDRDITIGPVVGSSSQTHNNISNVISKVKIDLSELDLSAETVTVGGVVGDLRSGTLNNAVFVGSIDMGDMSDWGRNHSVGGIAGDAWGTSGTINNALNVGATLYAHARSYGTGSAAGGVVGLATFNPTLTNVYSLVIRSVGERGTQDGTFEDDAITESLTAGNWQGLLGSLAAAGWTWSEEFGCPVPAM